MESINRRYVAPFYLDVLHGNLLRLDDEKRALLVQQMRAAATTVTVEIAESLWRSGGWREAMMASWWAACWRWPATVETVAPLLIPSQTCYAGQAHCLALASIGSPEAVDLLDRYLAEYLPRLDLHYDQAWAMAALSLADGDRVKLHEAAWSNWCAASRPAVQQQLVANVKALRDLTHSLVE